MNSLLDDDFSEPADNAREVTLSTGTILGIFLGLSLLCGLFFGFGYKIGSRQAVASIAGHPLNSVPTTPVSFNSFKPAAGSPIDAASASTHSPSQTAATPPTPRVSAQDAPPGGAPIAHLSPVVPARPTLGPEPYDSASSLPAITVQVAAVTHQEDAELLVQALKAKGYPAFERGQPQDKFLHVQVGPFSNRKDAETAKQHLQADGYQPILK